MPTGYTSEICEKSVPFDQFVWRCARAFGAMIMMRDDPMDAPITASLPSSGSDYHEESIKEARRRVARFEKMTVEQADRLMEKDHKRAVAEAKRHIKKVGEVRTRLDAMRSQVESWSPPTTEHDGLKAFMLQQLDETIRFDGTVNSYYTDKIEKRSAEEWIKESIDSAKHDIEYHTKAMVESSALDANRNKWVADLRASVPYVSSIASGQ